MHHPLIGPFFGGGGLTFIFNIYLHLTLAGELRWVKKFGKEIKINVKIISQ